MTSYPTSSALVLTADHFTGVRSRRIFAFLIDLCIIGFLSAVAFVFFLILGILTLGLAWIFFPPIIPAVALIYNGWTISGVNRGTWGMRAMDLEVRQMIDGSRVSFLHAALHAVMFYVSWAVLTPLVLLVSLFTRDKRCLHDVLSGIVIMRRSH